MRIDKPLLDALCEEASRSPRLRMNRDMRNSEHDTSQRMLNALDPGTELPVHRHKRTSETCIVILGAAEEIFYDDGGNITERVFMSPGSDCIGVQIEAGRWHRLISHRKGTVIFETKDGPYEPTGPEDILEV